MRGPLLVTVALAALTGCSTAQPSSPATTDAAAMPSTTRSTGTDPASQLASARAQFPSATPAPSTAGDLDASTFPQRVGRWTSVPGEGDEGTYQPNGSWVHAVPVDDAMQGLALQACTTTAPLPRPSHVLVSDYKDPAGRRAVGQALRFGDAATAREFVAGYARAIGTCRGQTNPMAVTVISSTPSLVDRRVMLADATRWVEVVKAGGTLVTMVVANEQDRPLTSAELAAFTKAVQHVP